MSLSNEKEQAYLAILKHELIPALGCTEPIAISYACAKAKSVLGAIPDKIDLYCSGNIIKNVKAVTVPHSGGLRGMDVAAVLGAVGGDPELELQVLETVTEEHQKKTVELLKDPDYCKCMHIKGEENLDVKAILYKGSDKVEVEIKSYHTNIVLIKKNDEVLLSNEGGVSAGTKAPDKTLLNVKDILEYADTVDLELVKPILDTQIESNTAISNEGLEKTYGANVGKTITELNLDSVMATACARAAAGSDARMNGCNLPVVINSGSGNQGITVSMPVITYAEALKSSKEKLYRALVVSNLLAVHQKRYIGSLSAYCGAVSAGCAAGAGILYLQGEGYETICKAITNTIGCTGGMVCDGAKSSCGAKIAASVGWAIMAGEMAKKGRVFQPGEGLVGDDVEVTIKNYGNMAKYGMQSTDEKILSIMIDRG